MNIPKDFRGLVDLLRRTAKVILSSDDLIYIVAHIDADGIAAASILAYLLYTLDKPFIVKFVSQLRRDFLITFVEEAQPQDVIFCDIGSGQLDHISKIFTNVRRVIIFDHHVPKEVHEDFFFKLYHVNPRLYGYDGGKEISAAGTVFMLAYVFSRRIPELIKLSKAAIIGALGDSQDVGQKKSLIGLNKMIVEEGVKAGIVETKIDILLQGRETKPLYQALAETYNPILPGITNSLEGAVNFLKSIGLQIKGLDLENTRLSDLSEEQKMLLVEKLIERLMITYGEKFSIEAIRDMLIGYVYLFKDEVQGVTRDAREFSTLINACGKLGYPHIGLALILGDRGEFLNKALSLYKQYRYVLSDCLNKARKKIVNMGDLTIIDGREFLPEGVTSTVASILANSIESGDLILVASKPHEGFIKISIRKTRASKLNDIRGLLLKALEGIEGAEGGGHEVAAGAYIPDKSFDALISKLVQILGRSK